MDHLWVTLIFAGLVVIDVIWSQYLSKRIATMIRNKNEELEQNVVELLETFRKDYVDYLNRNRREFQSRIKLLMDYLSLEIFLEPERPSQLVVKPIKVDKKK